MNRAFLPAAKLPIGYPKRCPVFLNTNAISRKDSRLKKKKGQKGQKIVVIRQMRREK